MLQLTFNPGLTLTGFRTTRPRDFVTRSAATQASIHRAELRPSLRTFAGEFFFTEETEIKDSGYNVVQIEFSFLYRREATAINRKG